jgi:hypothetical protein
MLVAVVAEGQIHSPEFVLDGRLEIPKTNWWNSKDQHPNG